MGASSGPPADVEAVCLTGSVDAESLEVARHRVRDVGKRFGMRDLELTKFVLAVHELMVNAIRHGGGSAEVVVWTDAAGLRCSVTDTGGGIPRRYTVLALGVSDAGLPKWGLRLVRQICPDIRVETGAGGTRVEIGYPLPPRDEEPALG